MTFWLSASSKRNRDGIDPRLINMSNLAIQITSVDFGHGPHSGLRTAKEQNKLHLDGHSPKCDGFIILSNHQKGLALDYYAFVDGHATWEKEYMAMVATAFLQAAAQLRYPVKWGGLWKKDHEIYGWDMAHIELIYNE